MRPSSSSSNVCGPRDPINSTTNKYNYICFLRDYYFKSNGSVWWNKKKTEKNVWNFYLMFVWIAVHRTVYMYVSCIAF